MGKLINEIGNKYGYLTIIEKVKKENNTRAFFKCKCDCGNEIVIDGYSLRSGHTKSCGCKRKEIKNKEFNLSLIGKVYNNWTVLEPYEYNYKQYKYFWKCKCTCGNICNIEEGNLLSGRSSKCSECAKISRGNVRALKYIKPGDKFGRYTVIEKVKKENAKTTDAFYKCRCECGKEKIVTGFSLRNGTSKSCGCFRKELFLDTSMIGKKYAMLTILGIEEPKNNNKILKCKCDCGNIVNLKWRCIKCGDAKSCGCLGSSYGEKKIAEVLDNLNITYKKEYQPEDLWNEDHTAHLRIDFTIKSRNGKKIYFMIEYDGEHHFREVDFYNMPLERVQLHDKMKEEYCKSKNISLLRIKYTEFNNIEEILTTYIKTNFNFLIRTKK